MKINYPGSRRLALMAMTLVGGVLLLATGLTGNLVLGILGMACWLLLLLSLLLGARFRMGTVISLFTQLSEELTLQREARDEMQRYVRDELVRSRRFQRRVYEKLALNEKAAKQRNGHALEALRFVEVAQRKVVSSLAESKRAMIDSHVLVVRAFQDASGQLDGLRSALESQLSIITSGSEKIDGIRGVQERASGMLSSFDKQLGLVAREVKHVDGLVMRLGAQLDRVGANVDGAAAAGRDMAAGFVGTVDQAVAPMRDRVDMLGTNVDGLRSALDSQVDVINAGFGGIDGLRSAHESVSGVLSSLDKQLGLMAGKLQHVDSLVVSLGAQLDRVDANVNGATAVGRDMAAGFVGTVGLAVAPVRDRVDTLGTSIDGIRSAQERASDILSTLDEQLGQVAKKLKHVDGLVGRLGIQLDQVDDSIGGVAAAGRDMAVGLVGTLDQAVAPMRSQVDVLGTSVNALLDKSGEILGSDRRLQGMFRRGADWIRYETVQEVEALHLLRDLLQLRGPSPPLGGWALDPTVMLELVRHVLDSPPENVVECGTGASTIWISRALEVAGRGRLVALEHDEVYAAKARALLERQGLSQIAQVVSAPISEVGIDGKSFQWYAPEALATLEPALGTIGLLLVDGPPKKVGPLARFPALHVLGSRLEDGAVIVIDDYNRDEERRMVRLWRRKYDRLGPPKKLSSRAAQCVWREVAQGTPQPTCT